MKASRPAPLGTTYMLCMYSKFTAHQPCTHTLQLVLFTTPDRFASLRSELRRAMPLLKERLGDANKPSCHL